MGTFTYKKRSYTLGGSMVLMTKPQLGKGERADELGIKAWRHSLF
jgi:hypothetical protein